MPQRHYTDLLSRWESDYHQRHQLIPEKISVSKDDTLKLQALAQLFDIPKHEIAAALIHQALHELEEQMPYIPGNKVIRIEEGEQVYEDIGLLPKYLAIKKSLDGD